MSDNAALDFSEARTEIYEAIESLRFADSGAKRGKKVEAVTFLHEAQREIERALEALTPGEGEEA